MAGPGLSGDALYKLRGTPGLPQSRLIRIRAARGSSGSALYRIRVFSGSPEGRLIRIRELLGRPEKAFTKKEGLRDRPGSSRIRKGCLPDRPKVLFTKKGNFRRAQKCHYPVKSTWGGSKTALIWNSSQNFAENPVEKEGGSGIRADEQRFHGRCAVLNGEPTIPGFESGLSRFAILT